MEDKESIKEEKPEEDPGKPDAEMRWDSDQLAEIEDARKQRDKVYPDKPENANVSGNKMRQLIKKARGVHQGYDVHPVIIKLMPLGNNRYYIIRSLTSPDMSKVEKMFSVFVEEAKLKLRKEVRDDWAETNGIKEGDTLSDAQNEELELFTEDEIMRRAEATLRIVNDSALSAVGVVWPENYKEILTKKMVPSGDLSTLAASISVLSGWSQTESDVEVYEERLIDEMRGDRGIDESNLEDEKDSESTEDQTAG